jgi:hypothetical protein
VGYFESDIFHPAKWDPIYPIPAFENRTNRDSYWGAKLVTSLRDDDLAALVDAGQLTNPAARTYLLETLKTRRDKIGRHWFSKVNPLDFFEDAMVDGTYQIVFRDLAVEYGYADGAESEVVLKHGGRTLVDKRQIASPEITLTPRDMQLVAESFARSPDKNLYELQLRTRRDNGKLSAPVVRWLWFHEDRNALQLVGVDHRD